MSTFLTPPVWYDKNGNLIEMLTGTVMPAGDGLISTNLAIGKSSVAGTRNQDTSGDATAVGFGASAYDYATALGSGAFADSIEGIAIGHLANVTGGSGISIAAEVVGNGIGIKGSVTGSGIGIGGNANGNGIGIGGNATEGKIQLGNSSLTYELTVGNGRMSLNIGSTDQSNWISATSNGISQGLYLVRYGIGNYIDLVYLMAPIAVTGIGGESAYTNDWYFPFYTNPLRLTINDSSHPIVCSCYYLKVDKTSSASNLKITPGYYKNNGDSSTPVFQNMGDGDNVYLFKIL